VNKAHAVT